jgi:hypothetical protein
MADFWFAECIPCQWEEKHTTQDAAIAAAEDHVFDNHRKVPSAERGKQKIGHVQNRTENAVTADAGLAPDPGPDETAPPTLDQITQLAQDALTKAKEA